MTVLSNAKMLIRYKAWSNDLSFANVSSLPEKEQTKVRKTTFKTMVSTLNHIYVIDMIFQSHLTGVKHGYTARNTPEHPPLLELWEKQKVLNEWYINYISSVSEEDFLTQIEFEFVGGGKGTMTPNQIILHLVNHCTYHSGFVSDMMYQVPAIVPANDITVFLRDVWQPC